MKAIIGWLHRLSCEIPAAHINRNPILCDVSNNLFNNIPNTSSTYSLNIFSTCQTTWQTTSQVPASSWSSCKSNHSVWESLQWKYSVKRLPPHKIPFQMTHTPFSQFSPSDRYNFSSRIYIKFIYLKYSVWRLSRFHFKWCTSHLFNSLLWIGTISLEGFSHNHLGIFGGNF